MSLIKKEMFFCNFKQKCPYYDKITFSSFDEKRRCRKMELNEKERHKYEIIEQLVLGNITRKESSFELNLSLKQIDRLKKKYYQFGETGFAHKNRGNIPHNKITIDIIEELENVYLTEFYDFNFVAFYEAINEKEKYKGK